LSELLHLRIGVISPYCHAEGTLPVSKQTLNRLCQKYIVSLLFKVSAGIPSYPGALFLFSDLTAFSISNMSIPLFSVCCPTDSGDLASNVLNVSVVGML